MGLFGRKALTGNVAVGLTPLGKQKAEQFEAEGIKFQILNALNDMGSSTINEVAQEIHANARKTEEVIKAMIHSGYIKVTKGEG